MAHDNNFNMRYLSPVLPEKPTKVVLGFPNKSWFQIPKTNLRCSKLQYVMYCGKNYDQTNILYHKSNGNPLYSIRTKL